jgi:hypothetical protein
VLGLSCILGVGGAERQFAGPIAVAWDAQIPRIAQIRAKPEGVIANDLGPVIHYLVLVLRLQQMAVACVYVQARSEA